VVDLDIQKFFDSVPWGPDGHSGGGSHRRSLGCCLYVKRWLAAPVQLPDGTLQQRDRGTPTRVSGFARTGESVPPLRV